MSRIGIICGSGDLPLSIGKNLLESNYQICFFCIKNFANSTIYNDHDNIEIEITSFAEILNKLEIKKIDKIIMAGSISRPSIKDIKFDLNTLSIIKEYLLESKGDDQLLRSISSFFAKKGYPLFDWKSNCKNLFATEEHLTIIHPSTNALKNKFKGLDIFKSIGKSDIGQSIIIQNQLILGVECLEGTDELILRCKKYKKGGDKGILLKLSKYKQHSELDLPTIGMETVKNLKENNYEGLFIERNKCIILNQQNVIKYCNKNKLFLSTVKKID
jgi:DUF1009 family protein